MACLTRNRSSLSRLSRLFTFSFSFLFLCLVSRADTTISLREFTGANFPTQPVEMRYSGGKLSVLTRLMSPNGVTQAAYQQLTNNDVLLMTNLPGSTVHSQYAATGSGDPRTSSDPNYPNSLDINGPTGGFAVGQAVQYNTGGGTSTCGLANGDLLYVKSYTFYPGVRSSVTFSATPGG